MKPSIPEISVDSQALIKRLKEIPKGETISYDDLSKVIASDVRGKSNYALKRALHRLVRDERIVFGAVHGVGLKRLEDKDHVGIGQSAVRKFRRASRKAAEKMMCADYDKLNNEEKLEFNTQISILGALSMVTKSNKVLQIREAVRKSQDRLPLNQTLEAFKQ